MSRALLLLTSCAVGFLGTTMSIRLARISGIVDRPGAIKIHDRDMPRLGGLGIVVGTVLTMELHVFLSQTGLAWDLAWVVMSFPLLVTGVIDDARGLSPRAKLLGQALSSLGISVVLVLESMHNVGGVVLALLIIVSAGFLCFSSNSMNLLDGMDGLLSGIAVTISFSLAVLAVFIGQYELAILPICLAGATLGFAFLNLPPARTFMGDVGSNFLGYVLGIVTLRLMLATPLSLSKVTGIGLILLVPIGDTTLAIVRRLRRRRDPLAGDRLHLYDCLYQAFGSRLWVTLVSMWFLTLASCLSGIIAFRLDTRHALVLGLCGIGAVTSLAARVGSLGGRPKAMRSGPGA